MQKEKYIRKNKEVFDSMPNEFHKGEICNYHTYGKTGTRKAGLRKSIIKVAAILALPLGIYTVLDILKEDKAQTIVAETINTKEVSSVQENTQALPCSNYSVNDGVRGNVQLPDGTLVKLNGGSQIILSEDFSQKRAVRLIGEAYFNIKSDKSNPFYIITTNGVSVRVTGTEFNLRCYPEQESLSLSLVKGSVELLKDEEKILEMEPNHQVKVSRNGSVLSYEEGLESSIAWKEGKLVFDATPMQEVLEKIEHWYGVEFVVKDEDINNSSFTAEFGSESLMQVLDILALTSELHYSISNTTVTLSKKM